MSVTVVGSVALDTVETPWGKNEEGLGGAATFFSLAAANYTTVHLVAVVGEDFPAQHIELLKNKGVNLDGLERAPGKTFRWSGRYHDDMNQRDTLDIQLNVFESFHPQLPKAARDAKYLFLGNIHPALQLEVLEKASMGAPASLPASPRFVALDTMNLWIHNTPNELRAILQRVDAIIINDSEVRDLTGQRNLVKGVHAIHALGPRIVVVKKGEHGCLLYAEGRFFAAPALPLGEVVDPTGAGDTFAGGFMGHIARQDATDFDTLKQAVVHGSVVASFTCEQFGPARLGEIGLQDIRQRYRAFQELTVF